MLKMHVLVVVGLVLSHLVTYLLHQKMDGLKLHRVLGVIIFRPKIFRGAKDSRRDRGNSSEHQVPLR